MARDLMDIRRDIQDSRDRLRQTAEAIGWKLDVPARARDVLRETAAVVRERVVHGDGRSHAGPAADGASSVIERARNAIQQVTGSVGSAAQAAGDRVGSAKDTMDGRVDQAREALGEKVGAARDSVSSAASSIGHRAGSAGSGVSSGMSSAGDAVSQAGGAVASRLPSGGDVRERAERASSVVKGNPAVVAIGALALGAAAGLLLPSTRVEDERIGPMAEDLRDKGAQTASAAMQEGRAVVEERGRDLARAGREALRT